MKIGLVGPTYQQRSLPFDAQRTVNLYPIFDQQGKEIAALYGTPGRVLFADTNVVGQRGLFATARGQAFSVSGNKLFEVASNGVTTELGTLSTSTGNVTMAENGTQLAICDGTSIYIYSYVLSPHVSNGNFDSDTIWTKGAGWTITGGQGVATASSAGISQTSIVTLIQGVSYQVTYTVTISGGTITPSVGGTNGAARSVSGTYTETIIAGATQTIAFTGAGLTGTLDSVSVTLLPFQTATTGFTPSTVSYIGGYFAASTTSTTNSGRFYISGVGNGLSWGALDFATAESSPDSLKATVSAVGQLWLFGEYSTEIWTNTGDTSFPFKRISGATIDVGVLSAYTPVVIDNGVIFLGQDRYGKGIVYKTNGFNPQRISTTPIEIAIVRADDPDNIRAYLYQEDGAVFYVLTGGGLATSLCYDLTTQQWHERAYLNADGNFEQDLAIDHMFIFGKHLVGDRRNGKIYEQSLAYYDDAGESIARERVYTHLSDEDNRIRYNSLEIGFENGVGLQSGQGSDPLVSFALSKDGGRTWSDTYTRSIGAVGEYQQKVVFRRLGIAEQMTFKIRITEPVKVAIIGSYLR